MANIWRCTRHFAIRRPLCWIPKRYEQHSVEKEPLKTTVSFITDLKDKEGMKNYPPYILSYSTQGFHIKGIKVVGSVAVLPMIFYHWRDFFPFTLEVKRPEDITPESLALFTIMEPPVEIVVVGTGEKTMRLDPAVQLYLKSNNIRLEVQDTANAAATFNFLLEETRLVGAALIPPLPKPE